MFVSGCIGQVVVQEYLDFPVRRGYSWHYQFDDSACRKLLGAHSIVQEAVLAPGQD